MNQDTAIIIFHNIKENRKIDIEVPLDITVNELILGLSSAYQLDIDVTDQRKCFLKSENPIALLKSNKTLAEYGIHNGTNIFYKECGV